MSKYGLNRWIEVRAADKWDFKPLDESGFASIDHLAKHQTSNISKKSFKSKKESVQHGEKSWSEKFSNALMFPKTIFELKPETVFWPPE